MSKQSAVLHSTISRINSFKTFNKELIQNSNDTLYHLPTGMNRPAIVKATLVDSYNKIGGRWANDIKVVRTSLFSAQPRPYIVDGGHRYEASKFMEETFDYTVINETNNLKWISDVMIALNSQDTKWKPEVYVKHFMWAGKRDYKILHAFQNQYQITAITAAALLTGRTQRNLKATIEEGKFKVTHYNLAISIAEEIEKLRKILPRNVNMRCIFAFAQFYLSEPNYNSERMVNACVFFFKDILACSEQQQFLTTFRNTYNSVSM